MGPSSGGLADKVGNRYETRWTVRKLLELLRGHATYIHLEPANEPGIEFLLHRPGKVEAHQAKRQNAKGNWTIRRLITEEVISAADHHASKGREYHFVSGSPAQELTHFGEQARLSVRGASSPILAESHQKDWAAFTGALSDSTKALDVARQTWVYTMPEHQLERDVDLYVEGLIAGARVGVIQSLLMTFISNCAGRQLSTDEVWEELSRKEYDLHRAQIFGTPLVRNSVAEATGRWQQGVEAQLLHPEVPREAARDLGLAIGQQEHRLFLLEAEAGHGKSSAILQALRELPAEWPVLAIRLDHLAIAVNSVDALGEALALPASPVASLASAAGDGHCVLVIDQLDAVSQASGRLPEAFHVVEVLLGQARAYPNMRVVVGCRGFDLKADPRLPRLFPDHLTHTVHLGSFTDLELDSVLVKTIGADTSSLSDRQRELLRVPFQLSLFSTLATEHQSSPNFANDYELLEAFWEAKRAQCRARRPSVRFSQTINTIVDRMAATEQLSVPIAVVEDAGLEDSVDTLLSERVLTRDGNRLGFFHERFYDFAFARRWLTRTESLLDFVVSGGQQLHQRSQVRQIIQALADAEPRRLATEVRELLSSDLLRFHIKDAILEVIRHLPRPDHELSEVLVGLVSSDEGRKYRRAMRSGPWFSRLLAGGVLHGWIRSSDDDIREYATELMVLAPDHEVDYLAELVLELGDSEADIRLRRWLISHVDPSTSRAWLDIVLDRLRAGEIAKYELLWKASGQLLKNGRADWLCEVLEAWFGRPENRGQQGLEHRHDQHALNDVLPKAAESAPKEFVYRLLGPILQTASEARYQDERPARDRVFAFRNDTSADRELADVLVHAMAQALRHIPESEVDAVVGQLRESDLDIAQWLLYQLLIGNAPVRSKLAVDVLLEADWRWVSGVRGDDYWTTRELIQAIAPYLESSKLRDLELAIRTSDLCRPKKYRDHAEFTLLDGLAQWLSSDGRRRLQELQRKFSSVEPKPPEAVRAGEIRSPIPADAARQMSDDQWVKAMIKHNKDVTTSDFVGGVEELARVLSELAAEDPDRYARLGLRLDEMIQFEYLDGILLGLQKAEEVDHDLIHEFVRHAISFDGPYRSKYAAWCLSAHYEHMPGDLAQWLIDTALDGPMPNPEEWSSPENRDNLRMAGMNSTAGAACMALSSAVYGPVEVRELVASRVRDLASLPSLALLSCVVDVIDGLLVFEPDAALSGLDMLLSYADDRLLEAVAARNLIVHATDYDLNRGLAATARMLASTRSAVREAGGEMAAYIALQLDSDDLLDQALSGDTSTRTGVARIAAARLASTDRIERATEVLARSLADPSPTVAEEAAGFVIALRDRPLRPYLRLLTQLVQSDGLDESMSQLMITLQRAPDDIDELSIQIAERYVSQHAPLLGDVSTKEAFHAKDIVTSVMGAYSRAHDDGVRVRALDLFDKLLEVGAYGASQALTEYDGLAP